MGVKFKNGNAWKALEKTIPGSKEVLRDMMMNLHASYCVNLLGNSGYRILIDNKKQMEIKVCANENDKFINFKFFTGLENVNVTSLDTFKSSLDVWCEHYDEYRNLSKSQKKEANRIERKGKLYSIEEVLSKRLPVDLNKKEARVDFDGDLIYMNSHRYELFDIKGVKCVECGLEGKFFAKERYYTDKIYHFNLYAIDENGNEVLMTKDHIVPKSKGGLTHIDNHQTMCTNCNFKKGDKLIV